MKVCLDKPRVIERLQFLNTLGFQMDKPVGSTVADFKKLLTIAIELFIARQSAIDIMNESQDYCFSPPVIEFIF